MLYVVPTPIGNLEDITVRALNVLRQVDVILAEDTRHSSVLLKRYDITKPILPYHQHNEHKVVARLVQRIKRGESMALISDAGTPVIADAGYLLVRQCVQEQVPVTCLPGAVAFVPALVLSTFPAHEFVFGGFLPPVKGRRSKLQRWATEGYTVVLYESPHRIQKLLREIVDLFGPSVRICVCRELTKVHEQVIRGSAAEVLEAMTHRPVRGEVTVVISPAAQAVRHE